MLLVRHGLSTWNVEGRWQGQFDPPLSPGGERAAIAARAALPTTLSAAVSSDLRRASDTARLLAPDLPLELDPDLRERAAGPWQGLTKAEIDRRWPGARRKHRHPEGWETDAVLAVRLTAALDRVAARHRDRDVLVVSHGGAILALVRSLGVVDGAEPANLEGHWVHHTSAGSDSGSSERSVGSVWRSLGSFMPEAA